MISPTSSSLNLAGLKKPAPRVLFSLDLDGSLIGPATPESIKVLNRLHDEGKTYTMLNTGNDLALLQQDGYGHCLKGLKVDCVSLSDGREIFINPKVESHTAETWFDELTPKDRDAGWANHVNEMGWDTGKVISVLETAIEKANNQGAHFIMDFHNTGFKGYINEVNEKEIHRFIEQIKESLKEQGMAVDARYSVKANRGKFYVVFNPIGINKAAPINFLAGRLSSLLGIVTLGDSDNDKEMLVPNTFDSGQRKIPNYSILVGGFAPLVNLLKDKAHAMFITGKEVPAALASQVESALAAETEKLNDSVSGESKNNPVLGWLASKLAKRNTNEIA